MASVIAHNPTEFHKVSNKTKEQLVEESEKDFKQYEGRADHRIKENNTEIKEADNLLVSAPFAPQQVQISGGSKSSDQWTLFKPQQNLAPVHLEQVATHLEVSKFVETNQIADCLSRLCGVVSRNKHTPDDNLRLLPMSKKAEVYKK